MFPSTASPPRNVERRTAERHPCPPQLLCMVIDPLEESAAPAGVRNESSGGMCLLVEMQLLPGAWVTLNLWKPADESQRVEFAEVRYTHLVPSFREMYLTGFSFHKEGQSAEELPHQADDDL
jgi:hypothetical protein